LNESIRFDLSSTSEVGLRQTRAVLEKKKKKANGNSKVQKEEEREGLGL